MDTCKVCDLIQPKTSPGKREEAMQTKTLPVRDNTSKLPDIGPESSAQPKNQRKQTDPERHESAQRLHDACDSCWIYPTHKYIMD